MFKSFLYSLGLILALDFIWLGFVMKDFNLRQLSSIGRIEDGKFDILVWPALVVYILMALSMVLFSIPKADAASSHLEAWLWGAALGLFIYGIYDLTNLSVLKGYPLPFALMDIAWGTFLYGTISWFVGYKLS